MYVEDTIAAIATPPGPGAIGVIRVSGPACESIAGAVFSRARPGIWRSHVMYRGQLTTDGQRIDDALAVLMRAPHSYTGEDVLELHCHGSPVVLAAALQTTLGAGARAAEPGEFTKRAFLNGKLDLTQAEAVVDLIRARTPGAAAQAADQLFGHLGKHLTALRQRLIAVKAHLEARIDFSDEELDLDDDEMVGDLDAALARVRELLATYEGGRLVREGLRIAITGRPNVGKSSLLNALAQADRAIVTEVPGTTRDVIEEGLDFHGVPVVVADTAGLRDTDDEIERIGVDRARQVAAAADLVLVVLDRSAPYLEPTAWPAPERRSVIVLNKIDLAAAWTVDVLGAAAEGRQIVEVSAKTGTGLDELRTAVVERAGGFFDDGVPPLTNARQRDSLIKIEESVTRALSAANNGTPADLIAVDVQVALQHIGTVTGAITDEEVLDAVFRDFCLGK